MKKAKEYFSQYKDSLVQGKETSKFAQELMDEVADLIKIRGCKTPDALIACYKEINNKYNSVCSMLEKEYGESVLILNGFKQLVIAHYKETSPEVALFLEQSWK